MTTTDQSDSNVGLAFGITLGAGTATGAGALVSLCIPRHQPMVLAAFLSFSSGVMVFVAFVSIMANSISSWREVDAVGARFALAASSCCFFGGMAIIILFDVVAHNVGRCCSSRAHSSTTGDRRHSHYSHSDRIDDETVEPLLVANDDDDAAPIVASTTPASAANDGDDETKRRAKLRRLALFTATAMVIHNIPEGIATYISTLQNARLGASLALAVALHNVPAGISIAAPFYCATGSRWKAVALTVLVGACEPLGALLAFAFLSAVVGSSAFGALFGLVAGMLVYVSLLESLPMAQRLHKRCSSVGFIAGMFTMAVSLVCFELF